MHIGDRDLAERIGLQGVEEIGGGERLHIAVALHLLLHPVHGIGNIHREDELRIDGDSPAARLRRENRASPEGEGAEGGGGFSCCPV